jgi:fructose/tagatose bisphosphate aldolase
MVHMKVQKKHLKQDLLPLCLMDHIIHLKKTLEKTKEIVALCHAKGVSVEAEVGSIGGEEDGVIGAGEIADPKECALIAATGVDMFAAGIGNIHGKYPENWKGLDFEVLEEVSESPIKYHLYYMVVQAFLIIW